MCGIAGIIDKRGHTSVEELTAAVGRMNESMVHRGPDDQGIWVAADGHAALGHRRLAVIDPSPGGHQPMLTGDGRGALVFNGEIYNHRTLRRDMEAGGSLFRSHSDTEVLLECLRVQGAGSIDRLDGMFAFAYYDAADRSLLLARDAFGEKPLYFHDGDDYLIFASELSAILRSGLYKGEVEPAEVAAYLFFRYLPQPHTIFPDIRKLEPGTWLRFSGNGRETRRHFRFSIDEQLGDVPEEELVRRVEDAITASVESMLVSDVPLGAFLSSGVDSSLVCAIATRKLGIPLDTYTIGFDAEETEHREAAQIAAALGTRHHCRMVTGDDLLETAATLGRRMDEPNGDRSCVPTYLLSRYAREGITVALSGDGGDELFGGYGRYHSLNEALARNPGMDFATLYFNWFLPVMPLNLIQELFGSVPERFRQIYAGVIRHGEAPGGVVNRLRALDAASYLPGAVLAKVDRMSMAHGLEVRAPLLNRHIAGLAGGIPLSLHTRDGRGKYLLRKILKRHLPAEWVDRKKTGFGMPGSFFKANKPFFDARIKRLGRADGPLAGLLDVRKLAMILPVTNRNAQWACIVLDDWLAGLTDRVRADTGSPDILHVDAGGEAKPAGGELIRQLLDEPLPRRESGPAPDIRPLIAAFDRLHMPPAWVNVYTFHVGAGESYQPILNADLDRAYDHRRYDYEYLLAYFSFAARTLLGRCNVILVTDESTPLPRVHGFNQVLRLPLDKQATMYERVRTMTAYVHSSAFNADTLFLDSDAILGQDITQMFNADFDVAFTFRPDAKMILNEGVQFASARRKEAVRRFYDGYLACYRALEDHPKIRAEYPQGIRRWRGGQLALNVAGWDGVYPEHGRLKELDGVRILYLDSGEYNYKPRLHDAYPALAGKKIVHFKGTTKAQHLVRNYALFRDLPGWALNDLLLGLPEGEAMDLNTLSRMVRDHLKARRYPAVRNLCDALQAQPDLPPLMQGILQYYQGLVRLHHDKDPRGAQDAFARAAVLGPLTPAIDQEINRLLAKLAAAGSRQAEAGSDTQTGEPT